MNSSLDQLAEQLAGMPALEQVLQLQHDQENRWKTGERLLVEEYLRRFPSLHEEPENLLVLILSEVEQREARGETFTRQEYYDRFPLLHKELELQLQFHSFLKPTASQEEEVEETETYAFQTTAEDDVKPHQAPVINEETRKVGRFLIRKELGQGSFGIVYQAYDPTLERDVALKVPKRTDQQKEVERFVREAKAAAKLQHPNIVTVFDCSSEPGASFIAMEWVDGVPLNKHVEQYRPSHQQVAKWLRDLALALHAAHEKGVLHRDVKPANIMVDRNNRVRLMDFGLAKQQRRRKNTETADSPELTQQGALVGTPAYMSPEQAEGSTNLTYASDQFSLGVLGYELLTEKRPYTGKIDQLIDKLRDPNYKPLSLREQDSTIAYGLEAIVMKALKRKPEKRYSSMSEMAVDLHRWLKGDEVQAPLMQAKKNWRCPNCQRLNAKSKDRCVYCKHHLSGGVPEDWTEQSVINIGRQRERERRREEEPEPGFRIRFWEWSLIVITGLLLALIPFLQQADRASMQAGRTYFSLHEIGVAFANYAHTFNHYPMDILDKQTKEPLLSWRVAILPFLGQEQLYKQFHLDEPWDSEHNKKLLAEMPPIFDPGLPGTWFSPGSEPHPQYTTMIQGFAGKGGMLEPGKKIRMPDISDGTSHTISLVGARTSVPWSKPQDLPFEEKGLPEVGEATQDHFFTVFCDGSVKQLNQHADPEKLRMLITYAGGEAIDQEKLITDSPIPVPRLYFHSSKDFEHVPTTQFPSYRPKHWSDFSGWMTYYLTDYGERIWLGVLVILLLVLAKLGWVWSFYRRQAKET